MAIEKGTKIKYTLGNLGAMNAPVGTDPVFGPDDKAHYSEPDKDQRGWHITTVERGGYIFVIPVERSMFEVLT